MARARLFKFTRRTARSTEIVRWGIMNTQKCQPALTAESDNGLKVSNLTKIRLIRKFQRFEGNYDCYASAYTRVCKQFECLWRDECLLLVKDEAL